MDQAEKDKIIHKLIDAHRTISTMESCTSGLIASTITDTEGASAIFPGGYVTYLNETKIFVGVDKNVISQYGVYSKECAEEMAKTVQKKMKTDIAIGITGTLIQTMQTVFREWLFSASLCMRTLMFLRCMQKFPA